MVMDKQSLYELLSAKHSGDCIVPGCNYVPSWLWVRLGRRRLCIRRITPGKSGGTYTPSNTVLVCASHHKGIEGMTLAQIKALPPEAGRLTPLTTMNADGELVHPWDSKYPHPHMKG